MSDNNDLPPIEPYTVDTTTTTTLPAEESSSYYEDVSYDDFEEKKRSFPIIFLAFIALIIFGVLILLYFLLTSTKSPTSNNNSNSSSSASTQQIQLEFWGAFIPSAAIQPLLDEYATLNPNIKISYQDKWPISTSYRTAEANYRSELNKYLSQPDSFVVPDIYMVNNSWAGDYETYSAPSTNYTVDEYAQTFYPAATTDFVTNGAIYGVPLWMDTLGILYNKSILSQSAQNLTEPPDNWDQFQSLAKSLTIIENGSMVQAGFAAGTPENTSFSFQLFNLLMLQNGVVLSNNLKQPNFADAERVNFVLSAFNFYKSFLNSNQTWDSTLKYDAAEFAEGDAAMIVTTPWRYRDMLNLNDEYGLGLDMDVSPMPGLSGGGGIDFSFVDYWGAMVSKLSFHQEASWTFLKWLNEPEQLQKLSDNIKQEEGYFGLMYARQDMLQQLKDDTYLKNFARDLPNAQSWYMVKGIEVKILFDEFLKKSSTNVNLLTTLQDDVMNYILLKGQLTQ